MTQKTPLGVEKVTTLVSFISESNLWGVDTRSIFL